MKANILKGRVARISRYSVTKGAVKKAPIGSGEALSLPTGGVMRIVSRNGKVWMNRAARVAMSESAPVQLGVGVKLRSKEEVIRDLKALAKKRFP